MASETSSRRLHISFVTVHSCDVSFRAFWGCCRKYSLIGFFKARKRTIILNWLGSPSRRVMFRKGNSCGWWERWGPAGQRVEGSIFYICAILFMRWQSNEAKETPYISIIKHNNKSRRYASNLKTKRFCFMYDITPENTKY